MLVEVEWCGICGTDVEEFTDGPVIISTTPHPLTGAVPPITLGHEVAGRIRAAGPGVGLAVDSLVALDGYLPCWSCAACRRGQLNRCDRWGHIGLSAPGGLAERLVVPARMAVAVGDDLPAEHAALAEPYAVAVRAVRRATLQLGERALVIGGGTIGLAVLQVLLTSGCGETTLVEPLPSRRSMATGFGATAVAADISELLGGGLSGAYDLAVDCTGRPEVVPAAIPLVRAGGRIVLVGLPPRPSALDLTALVVRELSLVGSIGHVVDRDTAAAVALLGTGRVDPAPLITHRIALEHAVEDGILQLAGPARATALKMLVSPHLSPTPSEGSA